MNRSAINAVAAGAHKTSKGVMKAMALAGMLAMAAAAIGCAQPNEPATSEASVTQDEIQSTVRADLKALGLVDASSTDSVTKFTYKDQSGSTYKYTLDATNTAADSLKYNVTVSGTDVKQTSSYSTTFTIKDGGILTHDSNSSYAKFFIQENGKIVEYHIDDTTNEKTLAYSYAQDSTDSTKLNVYDSTGVCLYTYSDLAVNKTEETTQTTTTVAVEDTEIYKIFESLGITPTTQTVETKEGYYQPKTGDIMEIAYDRIDESLKSGYSFTLDRENSKENELKYKGTQHSVYGDEDIQNTVTLNKAEKSIAFYDIDNDNVDKFTLNSDNTITYTITNAEGTFSNSALLLVEKDTHTFKDSITGENVYGNFKLSLAK